VTNSPFFWPVLLVFVAVALATALLLFWDQPTELAARPPDQTPVTASRKTLSGDGFGATDAFSPGSGLLGGSGTPVTDDLSPEFEEPGQPWEMAINQFLDSDEDNDKVAASLAALAPTLPLEGQVEAIQHMVNLLDDEQYALAQNMVMNPGLHPDVREVLFSDVLDRPNAVKLPVLLALLSSPGHPLRTEAHTNLQAVIGQDLGQSPMLWSQPVQAFLEREAAEEAEAEAELEESQAPDEAR
jgi:hypothetical protein